MAALLQIFKATDESNPLYSLHDNQAYYSITTPLSLDSVLTIRDGNRICTGNSNETLATFRDGKWLYQGDGYNVLYTYRDNSSYQAICKGEQYDSFLTVRDNQAYIAICKGDSLESEYVIRGQHPTPIQVFALLFAVEELS